MSRFSGKCILYRSIIISQKCARWFANLTSLNGIILLKMGVTNPCYWWENETQGELALCLSQARPHLSTSKPVLLLLYHPARCFAKGYWDREGKDDMSMGSHGRGGALAADRENSEESRFRIQVVPRSWLCSRVRAPQLFQFPAFTHKPEPVKPLGRGTGKDVLFHRKVPRWTWTIRKTRKAIFKCLLACWCLQLEFARVPCPGAWKPPKPGRL